MLIPKSLCLLRLWTLLPHEHEAVIALLGGVKNIQKEFFTYCFKIFCALQHITKINAVLITRLIRFACDPTSNHFIFSFCQRKKNKGAPYSLGVKVFPYTINLLLSGFIVFHFSFCLSLERFNMLCNAFSKVGCVVGLKGSESFLGSRKTAAVLGKDCKDVGVFAGAIALVIVVRTHDLALRAEQVLFAANAAFVGISTGHVDDLL